MDCQERYFNTSFDTFQQEGTYQINVSSLNFSYLFYNEMIMFLPSICLTNDITYRRMLGNV